MTRCASLTVVGHPCRNRAQPEAPYCRWHEPARAEPVEFLGGPLDGDRTSLQHAEGSRLLYAVASATRGLAVVSPSRYGHCGQPDIVGCYRLRYDGLHALWRWERATVPAEVAR